MIKKEKEKPIVTGLCFICGERHPVFVKKGTDGLHLLDLNKYLMEKHQKFNNGSLCKGGSTLPDAIVIN